MDGLLITSATESAEINTCLTHCLPISSSNAGSVVPRPGAGPCGGMDAATEPPGTDSRRVPTLDAAPRCRLTPHTDQSCAQHLEFHANASVCCGRLHACRHGTRRKYVRVGSGAASMPLQVPRRYARRHHRFSSTAERKSGTRSGDRASGRSLCGRRTGVESTPPPHDLAQARLARLRAGNCPRPPWLACGPTGGP
ncbi:hypothetical protein FHT13_000084 [Xanthomonas arboricola]|nr:hypothetical protein [Xanthomonas arboricola]